jgi:hypothetical protein
MELTDYLREIRSLKEDYSDEIPDRILHSTEFVDGRAVKPKFKCRKGWFIGFYALVDHGIKEGFVSDDVAGLFDDFLKYANDTRLAGRLTTSEDIQRANRILEKIIEELE